MAKISLRATAGPHCFVVSFLSRVQACRYKATFAKVRTVNSCCVLQKYRGSSCCVQCQQLLFSSLCMVQLLMYSVPCQHMLLSSCCSSFPDRICCGLKLAAVAQAYPDSGCCGLKPAGVALAFSGSSSHLTL